MFCLCDWDLKHLSANYSLRITFSWGFYGHHETKRNFKSWSCLVGVLWGHFFCFCTMLRWKMLGQELSNMHINIKALSACAFYFLIAKIWVEQLMKCFTFEGLLMLLECCCFTWQLLNVTSDFGGEIVKWMWEDLRIFTFCNLGNCRTFLVLHLLWVIDGFVKRTTIEILKDCTSAHLISEHHLIGQNVLSSSAETQNGVGCGNWPFLWLNYCKSFSHFRIWNPCFTAYPFIS